MSLLTLFLIISYSSSQGIITALFSIIAFSLLTGFFQDLIESFFIKNDNAHFLLKPVLGSINLHLVSSALISFALVCSWVLTKNWFLSNLIAISFVMMLLRMVKLNHLKASCILLMTLFLYDVFWTLVTTLMTSDGQSVMSVVASGLDLPIKIVMPSGKLFESCAMLGLGDLVVPGLHLSFVFRFGKMAKCPVYFWTNLIGYALSLTLCIAVVLLTGVPQPALFYIVPVLLTFTGVVAAS